MQQSHAVLVRPVGGPYGGHRHNRRNRHINRAEGQIGWPAQDAVCSRPLGQEKFKRPKGHQARPEKSKAPISVHFPVQKSLLTTTICAASLSPVSEVEGEGMRPYLYTGSMLVC